MKELKKKNGSFFVPLAVFGAIIVLISLMMVVYIKSANVSGNRNVGDRQMEVFTAYQAGEKYLNFVDEAVKLSIRPALLKVADTGLEKEPACGVRENTFLWVRQDMNSVCQAETRSCKPSEQEAKDYFSEEFRQGFSSYIDGYNAKRDKFFTSELHKDYEPFRLENKPEGLELVGIAAKPVVVSKAEFEGRTTRPVFEYKVKPSFRHEVLANFLRHLPVLAVRANELLGQGEAGFHSKLARYNAEDKGLRWALKGDRLQTVPNTCRHVIGECPDCCGFGEACVACENDPLACCGTVPVCTNPCTKPNEETVFYNEVYALLSVGTGKSVYAYQPKLKSVEEKSVAYSFGLNWLEETGRSTTC